MTRKYDPTDMEQVSERQQDAELRRQQIASDWDWFMSAPQGRRILGGILASCGMFGSSYVQGDALGTAYNEGKRAIGLQIYAGAHAGVTGNAHGHVIADLMHEALAPNVARSRSSPNRNLTRSTAGDRA